MIPTLDFSPAAPANSLTPRLTSSITSPIAPEFWATMMRSMGSGCAGAPAAPGIVTDSKVLTQVAAP